MFLIIHCMMFACFDKTSANADTEINLDDYPVFYDLDDDGFFSDEDCDDQNPLVWDSTNDTDCDGFITENDCNDNDPMSLSRLDDADCNGFYDVLDFDLGKGLCVIDRQHTLHCLSETDVEWSVTETPEGQFSTVVVGSTHGCALDLDGYAQCWGSNSLGQLEAPPVQLSMLTASGNATCGLIGNHTITCWGDTEDIFNSRFDGGFPYNKIVLSGKRLCSKYSDTEIDCNFGEMYYGDYTFSSTINSLDFDIYGSSMCLAATTNNSFWGADDNCQGTIECLGPVDDEDIPPWTHCERYSAVAVADYFACFILEESGSIMCYGGSYSGVYGMAGDFSEMKARTNLLCALNADNTLKCTGNGTADFNNHQLFENH